MILYRLNLNNNKIDIAPNYLIEKYNNMSQNNKIFNFKKHNFFLKRLKFDSKVILVKKKGNNMFEYFIIGPKKNINSITVKSTDKDTIDKRSAVIGTYNNGTKYSCNTNYLIYYRGSIIEIGKGESVYKDKNGKIIIGWHGSYNPPRGM